jgi:arylformamidase
MSEFVYKGFGKEELERQFDPRTAVPDHQRWAEEREAASRDNRGRLKSWLNVPYGNSPRQVIDIFPSEKPDAPVLVHIHGGYWMRGGKDHNSHFVDLFGRAGVTVALVEYDLCPDVSVTEIVRQVRSAISWVYKNISAYGGDSSRLYLCGVSAGGHLVTMALAHDWAKEGLPRDIIKGGVAVSGVYDLDAVLHIAVNKQIRLNPETARENSPFVHPPLAHAPLVLAVGGGETEGWKQMSRDLNQHCIQRGVQCEYLEVPDANHFMLSSHLADPESILTRAIFKQMGLPAPAKV